MGDRLPYFSERMGRGPLVEPLPFKELRSVLAQVITDLRDKGYFQDALGHRCDGTWAPGTKGDPEGFFLLELRRRNIWPHDKGEVWENGEVYHFVPYEDWDSDTLFDVVEALHDIASRPTVTQAHQWGGQPCGLVYDSTKGRATYIARMNDVVRHHDPPYEMNTDGRLVERTPDEFRPLMSAVIPQTPESDPVEVKIEHAKSAFTARGATMENKREAVRALADCLELLKPTIKRAMLTKDESALFEMANKFSVRHLNREQRSDYDPAIWLRWMFYVNLATVHALLRVRAKQVS